MRKLTPYEKERWFEDGYHFTIYPESDLFLCYGDELGEAFDAAADVAHKRDYGLSNEFVKMAEVEVLDMYYDQMLLYTGEYGGIDEPKDLGLPPVEDWLAKAKELGVEYLPYFGQRKSDRHRRLWDWAMDWRNEHMEETHERQRIERLEAELARAKERHG